MRNFLKRNNIIRSIYSFLVYQKHRLYFYINPKFAAEIDFKKAFNRKIDWHNPQNIIEKNIWMQFNTDTTLWSECSDKYLVRDYVRRCGCGELLNKLYGYWESIEEINFGLLPNQFVLKANNGCGTVLLVKDKYLLDERKTKKKLRGWLNYNFGITNAQLHYLKIKPAIIAEELLIDKNNPDGTLIDYKFFCFYGKPESVLVITNRNMRQHSFSADMYSIEWERLKGVSLRENNNLISKPKSFNQMIDACFKLAQNIPFVRIDFYEIEGKPYFGEMTFSTGFGYLRSDYYDYLGTKLEIEIKRL